MQPTPPLGEDTAARLKPSVCGITPRVERGAAVSDGWIVTNVEILGGKPCVRGTRLSVEFLLELAASGATQADILGRYPQLTAEGLSAAFLFAARRLSSERSWDLPTSM